jgi:cell division protein FtsI (penicillin-binding protein 3)
MRAALRSKAGRVAPKLPRLRAPLVFGVLLALFAGLLGRSFYLQRFDNAFLQEQGSSRYSRELSYPRIAAVSWIASAILLRSARR